MSYVNKDGLHILTGAEEGKVIEKGVNIYNGINTWTYEFDLRNVGTTFGAANLSPTEPLIPAGSYIKSATVVMKEAAASSGAATLTIGTYAADGTAVDADGIDAAVALAAVAAGSVVKCDGAQAGGTATIGSAPVAIGMTYGTAAFTAGTGVLVVEYIKQ